MWQWSFPVSCLAWCDSVLESSGSIIVLPVTSRKDLCQSAPTRTDAASAPIPTAGQCQPTPPREILKHSQAGPAHSLVGSLLLCPGSWCTQDFVCAFIEEGERGQRKSWLKTQYSKKTKIVAFSPITSWQIDGDEVETASDCIFLGSKITVDSDYSHEIKKRLLLGRKAMTNIDSVLKSRSITLLTKVPILKAMVFLVVIYGCES